MHNLCSNFLFTQLEANHEYARKLYVACYLMINKYVCMILPFRAHYRLYENICYKSSNTI